MTVPKADILVIDDTPENLHLLSAMLTERGYKVRSVTKGSTGIRGAQAAPPDLILLDVNMPQMNGYEVCQQLKSNERTRDIPIIFISALGDVLDKVKAFAVGGVDYITKPFQVEEVLARIQTHLTICQLQKQLQERNCQLQQKIEALQRAEEQFAKAFRACPSPIAITDLDREGRFIEVNASFLQMSGYTREEILGRTAFELKLGIDQQAYNQALQQLLETGSLQNQECKFFAKSGEVRTVLLSLECIDLAGSPCVLNLVHDITERKRLENELISLVSHELRTPMTSLLGAMDLLGSGQLGTLTERGQQVLKIATASIERLVRLLNDFLDLERIRSGKIIMQRVQCNLAEIFEQAIASMQAMADQAKVVLVSEPVAVELWADPDRLVQTLTNLLSNAIKFSEPGKTIWLRARVQENIVQIEVEDQGRGIPEDKLQLIFERFQQVDASDSRKKGGTGLGLAICRSIVEQHGGQIWAESVPTQGSTFYIQLPLQEGS